MGPPHFVVVVGLTELLRDALDLVVQDVKQLARAVVNHLVNLRPSDLGEGTLDVPT